jgi:predicted Zn finger-like uncharacterized protein
VKTRCPACETTFWVTSEQLKARAGVVRCGQCQTAFNAIDHLLEEAPPKATVSVSPTIWPFPIPTEEFPTPWLAPEKAPPVPDEIATPLAEPNAPDAPAEQEVLDFPDAIPEDVPAEPLGEAEAEALELGKAAELILPRETTEIPGYSRWAESMMMSDPLSAPVGKTARGPFVLVALLLLLILAGQIVFHSRSEIAVAAPSLRPLLETLSAVLGADIPLLRNAELISIETSDLQADPTRSNLLVLQATVRNRASYAQDYPSLELSLTDTQDGAIARRVFLPAEYLPPQTPPKQAFPPNSDVAVRLWVEAKGISAAGYRLYVFYP